MSETRGEIPRSATLMKDLLLNTPGLLESAVQNHSVLDSLEAQAIKHLPTPAFVGDTFIYRVVVLSLGGIALSAVIGALLLVALTDKAVPDMVTALGSAAIGAIAGLLAPSPASAQR